MESILRLINQNYLRISRHAFQTNPHGLRMFQDLDDLIDRTLKEKYPLYYKLLIYKIDGKQNAEIQDLLFQEFGTTHSIEYLSSL